MKISWKEWLGSREAKRTALKLAGLDSPSRRKVSYNTSERRMVAAFGGGRVPAFALENGKDLM